MVLNDIVQLLKASVICGDQHLECEIKRAFAADLMSDVLRLNTEEMLLITGLANLQVIRTAEMSDINFILFVRDKKSVRICWNWPGKTVSPFTMFPKYV